MMFSLTSEHLQGRKIGLEREALRVDFEGKLATSKHPRTLGHYLTHPSVTVDYAEQMLEMVTKPHQSVQGAYAELLETTVWVQRELALKQEQLWLYSMPPQLPPAAQIEPAHFGNSGVGQFKHLYRVGLGHRYGREMQLISGTHFNYSLPPEAIIEVARAHGYRLKNAREARDQVYLGAIRNIQRYGWLVSYLLGASPMADEQFAIAVQQTNGLEELGLGKYQQASTLRMSDIGYTNKRRCRWQAELNSIDKFIDSIAVGLAEGCTIFKNLGLVDSAGNPIQINDKVLQIENEYYSIGRLKSIAREGETPLVALARYGTDYIEFRMTDIDPHSPIGISPHGLALLELLMLYCIITPSPMITPVHQEIYDRNRVAIANRGREDISLEMPEGTRVKASSVANWLLRELSQLAKVVDAASDEENLPEFEGCSSVETVQYWQECLANNKRRSQIICETVRREHEGDIHAYVHEVSTQAKDALLARAFSESDLEEKEQISKQSLIDATALENNGIDYAAFYADYQAQLSTLFADRQIPIVN